jgi:hypothetical protein
MSYPAWGSPPIILAAILLTAEPGDQRCGIGVQSVFSTLDPDQEATHQRLAMVLDVNRRRQLTTFLAISASNVDQTQSMNVISNPADISQRVVNLARRLLVKVERRFTPGLRIARSATIPIIPRIQCL